MLGQDRSGSSPHTRGAPSRSPRWSTLGRIIPAYAGSTRRSAKSPPSCADHPRIRGEHITDKEPATPTQGSSPHTRGAQPVDRHADRPGGIIPAYAGSTLPGAPVDVVDQDHPRIRGEHAADRQYLDSYEGSSPHTRGARPVPVSQNYRIGIIPAYAGSTEEAMTPEEVMEGSSPHTRGAPDRAGVVGQTSGIIPAYAGSTGRGVTRVRPSSDHPRIRGEHAVTGNAIRWRRGSSPHTRGAHRLHRPEGGQRRIIPAYAGSTARAMSRQVAPWDHPRIRGEHPRRGAGPHRGAGSSPHTRGARYRISRSDPAPRIIPAYAGSTARHPRSRRRPRDHPRIRGEHHAKAFEAWNVQGSSPHTRGAPRCRGAGPAPGRIIPAYAGSTHTGGAPRHLSGIIPAYAGSTWPMTFQTLESRDHPRIRGEHASFP